MLARANPISRQTGSLGDEITQLLAKELDLPVITRDLVLNQWFAELASKHEQHMLTESPAFFKTSSQGITFASAGKQSTMYPSRLLFRFRITDHMPGPRHVISWPLEKRIMR